MEPSVEVYVELGIEVYVELGIEVNVEMSIEVHVEPGSTSDGELSVEPCAELRAQYNNEEPDDDLA